MRKYGLSRKTAIIISLTVIVFSFSLFQCKKDAEIDIYSEISMFPDSGNYDKTIKVRINTVLKNAEIRYTTDGSAPDGSSVLYTGEITVAKSTIIQAAAFDSEGNMLAGVGSIYLVTPGNETPSGLLSFLQLDDGRTRFEVTATDPDNDPLKYRWYVDGMLQPAEDQPFFISDLRRQNERSVSVTVKIDDGKNYTSVSVAADIPALQADIDDGLIAGLTGARSDENNPPVLRLYAPYNLLEYGEEMRLTASASDADGDSLEYLWIIDDQVIQRGETPYLDFSSRPDKGRYFSVKVAVSDSINLKTAALEIFVNEKQPGAVIKNFHGKVEVLKNTGEWISVTKGMALELSDTVSTGFGAGAEVKLGDSVLTLQPMTRITLDALASGGGVQETSLFMRTGSVTASVDASQGKHDFEVMGPHATASVRGTQFSFDGLNLRVFEGKVALKMGPPKRNIQLNKQQARKPAEAEGVKEGDSAENNSSPDSDENTDSSDESTDEASDGEDEVIVGAGESAEVDIDGNGGTVVAMNEELSIEQLSSIQEISLPAYSLVNVEIKFQEVDTSSSISDSGQVIITGE